MGQKVHDAGVSIDELVRRYRAGETTPATGASIGVSAKTVRRWLMRAGVTLRPPGWVAGRRGLELDDADLIAYYRSGETLTEILKATGIGRSTVRSGLKRAGVEMRPPCHLRGGGASTCLSRRSSNATGRGTAPSRSDDRSASRHASSAGA
jgi:hypothetical protein